MYIASEHIQRWLETGKANIVPATVASRLGEYLDRLPWLPSGSGLDWSQISGSRAVLSVLTASQLNDWLGSTLLGNDPLLVFLYHPEQPCIACDMEFAISNFGQAFWNAPGKRYMFGASVRDGLIEPIMPHFAEYDGGDMLNVAR